MALFSGLYGVREDNKRQKRRQSGWVPLHLDQSAIHLHHSPVFFLRQMLFLPQPFQFILAWDRHRNMLDCIPLWLVNITYDQLIRMPTSFHTTKLSVLCSGHRKPGEAQCIDSVSSLWSRHESSHGFISRHQQQ